MVGETPSSPNNPLNQVFERGGVSDCEFVWRSPITDQAVWLSVTGCTINLPHQPHLAAMLILRDISQYKLSKIGATRDDYRDRLTGLINRTVFMDRVEHALRRTQKQPQVILAVLCLNVTCLDDVNDAFGYAAGDEMLVAITHRLNAVVRPTDTLSRPGGNEFLLLVEDVVSVSEVIDIAETILAELRQPFSLSGEIVTTHASLGISLGDSQTPSADVLLKQASIAMHKVKQSPHQRYCIFEDSIRGGNQSSLRLEMDLKRAIAQQELFLEYQPIVLVRNQKIIGMESLVRWHHSEQGVLPPTKFIPLAEKTGLIIPLGWWVLEESCRQLKHWQDTIPNVASLFVSVNMSSQQFSQADFLDRLTHILKSTGLDPKYLKIEITEGVLIENSESIIAILDAIRAMGIKLSIDDFGTGYSSLSYLHRFPVDTLKIDRSFLENADSDFEKLEILQSVVRLAWNLGLEVVAEGIETQRHLAQITSLRCESGQGFFFSRPLSQQAMEDFLSEET